MTSWLTSDLHLGHTNIIGYTNRPYRDAEEMNVGLVMRWNSNVKPDDEVWVLGDVALGRLEDSLAWVGSLGGTKHLLPGNHDRMFRCEGEKYARACQRYIDAGFVDVLGDSEVLYFGLTRVLACHFPYRGDSKDGHEDRYSSHRPEDRGGFLVHGHTHGLWRRNGRMVDVGVDAWGGYPVAFETVAELFLSDDEHAEALPWA